jgi:hypothetical protein
VCDAEVDLNYVKVGVHDGDVVVRYTDMLMSVGLSYTLLGVAL